MYIESNNQQLNNAEILIRLKNRYCQYIKLPLWVLPLCCVLFTGVGLLQNLG